MTLIQPDSDDDGRDLVGEHARDLAAAEQITAQADVMFPPKPVTLDDIFASGDPDDSYEEWWL